MKKMKLKIDGMHCVSCAMNIDGELEDLGVVSVSTSYTKQECDVEFDQTKITKEQVLKQIEKIGYKAAFVEVNNDN